MKSLLIAIALAVGTSTAAAAPTAPDELARNMVQRLQRELGTRAGEFKREPAKLHRAVDAIVAPHFDLAYIARLVLARHWKEATTDQRARFQEAFKGMLIRSYASALLEVSNSGLMEWQSLKLPSGATEAVVRSRVVRDHGPALPIGLAMRQTGGEWKIYDITVETVSLVSSFRGQIGSQIRQGGIDTLIARLERDGVPVASRE